MEQWSSSRTPSGLFPSGLFPSGPGRPTYREPHPVRFAAVLCGACGGTIWLLLFGLLARSGRGYVWLTLSAAVAAWVFALVLARFGDRGVAVGVTMAATLGASVAGTLVAVKWITSGWPLW